MRPGNDTRPCMRQQITRSDSHSGRIATDSRGGRPAVDAADGRTTASERTRGILIRISDSTERIIRARAVRTASTATPSGFCYMGRAKLD